MDNEESKVKIIQACGSSNYKDDDYSLSIGFEQHAITLDGLCKQDLLELQSCINCMLLED
jgi:hypothetical protein